jgi:signal transduction histidine kinase
MQAWTLEGELVRGRLFCLDKRHMPLDDLLLGLVVARLVVSRLDSLYLVKGLRDVAAMNERLRLARDLHDSLLQSISGSALQLLAARRLLDQQPGAASRRLEDVQNQLERGELEMRSFIGRLRPTHSSMLALDASLSQRLEELRDRVERQWNIKVRIQADLAADAWADPFANEVYRIIQEGVLNAARHADASIIRVDLIDADGEPRLEICDDGHGFPFYGTYDLNRLNALNRGPLTLKERVAGLRGDLHLRSTEAGTELSIRLPLEKAG